MKADWKRILAYFREHEGEEINAYEELVGPEGLRILEYTGRINNARRKINCHCAKTDLTPCVSREHILNTRKGFYLYYTGSRRGVQPITEFPTAPLLDFRSLPEKPAKLEGEALKIWNERLHFMKTNKNKPFDWQVRQSLV